MRTKYLWFGLMIIIISGLSGCNLFNKKDFSKQAVCIINNASLRAEPTKKGRWISALALGETVKLESEPIQDPADAKFQYVKVKLSDGTSGYVSTMYIVSGAYVGVVQKPVKLYNRPDLLADSNKTLDIMQIVAVEEEKPDWLRVTSEGKTRTGWIPRESIRTAKEDVVTAIMLRKALHGKEKTLTRNELEQIINGLPYPDNYFVQAILAKYNDLPEATKEEPSSEKPSPSEDPVYEDTVVVDPEEPLE